MTPDGLMVSAETHVRGRVCSRDRRAISGASIREAAGTTARSGSDGRFHLRTRAGARLTVGAPGYSAAEIAVPEDAQSWADVGDVTLLGAAAAVVEVVGASGAPVEGAAVAWTRARDPDESLNPRVTPLLSEESWWPGGVTDGSGRVRLTELPHDDPVVVRVLRDGAPIVGGPVAIREGEEPVVRVVLPTLHPLVVLSAFRTGEPIDPVRISRLDGPPARRWVREYASPEGRLETALPEGLYEVGVVALGRHLRRENVHLTGPCTVSLPFDRVDRVRIRARDEQGRPIDAFRVAAYNGEFPETSVRTLLDLPGVWPGRDGEALLEIPVLTDASPLSRAFVVGAAGFAIATVTVPWSGAPGEQAADVVLRAGVTVAGTVRGAPRGATARLYYVRDPGGVTWTVDAPRLDETTLDADGRFSLRGLATGTYEVRIVGPLMEIPCGTVTAHGAGTVAADVEHLPATVEVDSDAADPGSEPVLIPLVQGGKWAGGAELPARTTYRGTRVGGRLVFDSLAAGRYALDAERCSGCVWGLSPVSTRLTLSAGETKVVRWSPPPGSVEVAFRIVAPESVPLSDLAVSFVAKRQAPQFAGALGWTSVASSGDVRVRLPGSDPLYVVVADTRGIADGTNLPEPFPVHVAEFADARGLSGQTIRVEAPSTLTVRAKDADASVEAVHEAVSAVLRDQRRFSTGRPSPPLMPGRYRLLVSELGADRRKASLELELRSAEQRSVEVELR